jgi:phosphoribosyl 1,2-cyclic phosphodiesterase
MSEGQDFTVQFWGVRGSIAVPGPKTVRYGGNTSCLEIRCGNYLLIFDAGTGIRDLGHKLIPEAPIDTNIYLTHTHFDHICGLPFFVPLFISGNKVTLWAGHLQPEYSLKQVLNEMMMAPLFPVPLEVFQADVGYKDFIVGEAMEPHPGVIVRSAKLNHPNQATGYRIEFDGRSVCYITDTEHPEFGRDPNILELLQGSDLVIYDSMYTDGTYENFKGFGHSTWQEGVRLVQDAGAKKLVIFHHDPTHDDDKMEAIGEEAAGVLPGTVVAREGMILTP